MEIVFVEANYTPKDLLQLTWQALKTSWRPSQFFFFFSLQLQGFTIFCSVLHGLCSQLRLSGDVFWHEDPGLQSSVLAFLFGVGGSSCRSGGFSAGCSGAVTLKIETTLCLHCSIPLQLYMQALRPEIKVLKILSVTTYFVVFSNILSLLMLDQEVIFWISQTPIYHINFYFCFILLFRSNKFY